VVNRCRVPGLQCVPDLDRTAPTKRKPLQGSVLISRCSSPLSAMAQPATLMRVVSAASETMRCSRTAEMRSSGVPCPAQLVAAVHGACSTCLPDTSTHWSPHARRRGHQKNLSRTTIVSPGSTASVSLTLSSFFWPLTTRMICTRDVEPRSVTPPASANACSTVVFSCWSA
jgi:hypothetical protein